MALTQYAAVSVTPETDLAKITCANPLGVEPKLVRVKTNDRSEAASRLYEFVLTPSFGATLNRYNSAENVRESIRFESTPGTGTSSYRAYHMTANTIEIAQSSTTSKWKAGVTYTFHIYA